jgi:hypothetical protein
MATDDLTPQVSGLIKAALEPDEKAFFKAYLGQEAPSFMDNLLHTGRFKQARELREQIHRGLLTPEVARQATPPPTLGEAKAQFPEFPIPPQAYEAAGPGGGYDLQSTLPPASVSLLNQYQHREGLRQPVTPQVPAGLMEFEVGRQSFLKLRQSQKAPGQPLTPQDEADAYVFATKQFTPQPLPGTLGETKLAGEAKEAVSKGTYAERQQLIDLDQKKAGIRKTGLEADTLQEKLPFAAAHEQAIIDSLNKNEQLDLAKAKTALAEGKFELATSILGIKAGVLDSEQARNAVVNMLNRFAPGTAKPKEQSLWEKLTRDHKAEIPLQDPAITQPKRDSAPTMPDTTPAPQSSKPPSWAETLYKSMKDGEVKEYQGKKYKRVGSKLVPVK